MSAEPAHTGPTPGQVILFRTSKRAAGVARTHGTDSPPPASDLPAATPHHRLAQRLERAYLANGRTLTDPDTADDFRIAVSMFGEILEGAHVAGLVDDAAHKELHAMIDGMKAAPELVENA